MKALSLAALFLPFAAAIWPIPSEYKSGTGVLWIKEVVKVTFKGNDTSNTYGGATNGTFSTRSIVENAIKRTHDTIFKGSFIPWKLNPLQSNFEPATGNKTYIKSVLLKQTGADPKDIARALAGDIDESYSLNVPESGEVIIEAKTSIGLVRGLTTFSQLFYKHHAGGAYTKLVPVQIKDAPKFPWRGINMDVSRNWFPVDSIKKMIDAMAFNKFNRFHVHITDAQSWPLEIPSIPELAQKGSYFPGAVYSVAQQKDIQTYGALRGIAVHFEIDMPAHTSSIHHSFPELITAFNVQPNWDTYCAEPPCGSLKLKSDAVYSFLEKLWNDLLPRVAPYSGYFHTGGDEVNKNAYNLDDTVKSNDSAILQPLMQKFIDFNHDKVRDSGLVPIVWEEMLLEWNITLGKDVVVQTWQSDEALAQTVSKGHKALAGNYNYWYLDCGKGQWLDFTQGASAAKFFPYNDYCSPRKSWRLMYAYDPLHGVPANATDLVLGGETHIWAEQTDPVNIDSMVWPRACAAAEVLWSGAKDAQGQNRSQTEASPRLADMRERLVSLGIQAEPVQMPFCTMNGTQCAL